MRTKKLSFIYANTRKHLLFDWMSLFLLLFVFLILLNVLLLSHRIENSSDIKWISESRKTAKSDTKQQKCIIYFRYIASISTTFEVYASTDFISFSFIPSSICLEAKCFQTKKKLMLRKCVVAWRNCTAPTTRFNTAHSDIIVPKFGFAKNSVGMSVVCEHGSS